MPIALTRVPSLLQVVAYNKMDVPESSDYWDDVRQFLGEAGVAPDDILATSAATGQGVTNLVRRVRRVLDALPPEVRAGPREACLSAWRGVGDRWQEVRVRAGSGQMTAWPPARFHEAGGDGLVLVRAQIAGRSASRSEGWPSKKLVWLLRGVQVTGGNRACMGRPQPCTTVTFLLRSFSALWGSQQQQPKWRLDMYNNRSLCVAGLQHS